MKFNYLLLYFLLLFLTIGSNTNVYSQNYKFEESFENYKRDNYQEKVYLTTDRSFYIPGEIIWFKVYAVDGCLHLPTEISKIVYVELIGVDSTAHLQAKINLENGVGSGSFYLPTSLNSGKYFLRGYTNWMKNYDMEFFFQKELSVVNTFKNITSIEKENIVNITFYPEGGQLVSELESIVAFQATNSSGMGVDFDGWLLNNQGDTIIDFKPEIHGLGTFSLTPEIGENYKAVIKVNGENFYAQLPKAQEKGFVMRVEEKQSEVNISVKTNSDIDNIYLLSHGRNIVTHSIKKDIQNGSATITLEKEELIGGINHFTIFNEAQKPVAERLFFNMPEEIMNIGITTDRPLYNPHDKVSMTLSTSDNPHANLSASIFKLDSLNQESSLNIVSYLYLLSDLKGSIENLNYFLNQPTKSNSINLLMLTHGWSRFDWNDVMEPSLLYKKYVPEVRGHIMQGHLKNKETGQIAEGITTYLTIPGQHPRLLISKSDNLGKVHFEIQDYLGSTDIIISTNYLEDSVYQVELNDPFSKDYLIVNGFELALDKEHEKTLLERSIGMQALNIYNEKNVNLFNPSSADTTLFFIQGDYQYSLDDYTRFTTMEDVMREYVPNVWVRDRKGQFYFRVLDIERDYVYKNNPLILYDGMPVFDVNKIMKVDPLKVEHLEVLSKRYFYGKNTFDGIVSYKSYEKNLDGIQVDPRSLIVEYDFAQLQRTFYSPDYSEAKKGTTPDLRNLLYWNANIITDKDGISIDEFHTSEESGKYMIVVEGISANGKPGYSSKIIEINSNAK